MDRGAWRAAVPGVAESDAVGSGNTDSNSDPCVRPPDPALGQSPSGRVNLTLSLSEVTAVPPRGSTVTSSRPSHSGQQRLKPHWRVSPAWVQMPRLRGFPLQRGQRILRQDRAVSGRTLVTAAMKRHLLLGRKAMTNLDSILKSRDITCQQRTKLCFFQ